MYENYWGLQRKPFENTADVSLYYPSETHQAALLKLRYVMENGRHAAVLTGAPGLGKSLLIRAVFQQLPETLRPRVHVVFPQMSADELLAHIAQELSGDSSSAPIARSRHDSVRTIHRHLEENVLAGRHAIVVIDEAHLIHDAAVFECLRLLLNFEVQARSGLTLLFVGQPALLPLLDRQADLEERLAVKCLLRPFDLDESVAYVNHRLREAGAHRAIFSDEALEALHATSRGVPRQINRLGDLALLIGFAEESTRIEANAIDAVSEELATVVPE